MLSVCAVYGLDAKVCVFRGFKVSGAVLNSNTAAHCKQNAIRMAMLRCASTAGILVRSWFWLWFPRGYIV
jgi:hypothetical protein